MLQRILSLLALAFLASCGQKEPSSGTKLVVWVTPNSPDPQRDMERLIKGFKLEHPGIDVDVMVIDWGSAWNKFTTAATAQNGPDLVLLGNTWTATLTEMGALMPLDSLLESMGGAGRFIDGAMETARPRGSDFVTSVPWFVDVRPVYYRKDVLSRLAIEPASIADWGSFTAAMRKIRDTKPEVEGKVVLPFGFGGKNDWNFIHNMAPWIWGAGGDFLDSTATQSAIGSPESVRGVLFYLSLVRDNFNEVRNLEKNTAQVSADFDEGRLAFWIEPTSKTIYLDRPQFLGGSGKTAATRNYACLMPPTSPEGQSPRYLLGGSNFAIFKFTHHRKEAQKLLEYLVGRPDVQMQWCRASGFLPTLKEVYDLPYFRENANRQVFLKMVRQGRPYPSVPYWGEIETGILKRRMSNIFELISVARPGEWPEQRITQELQETDKEITLYIRRQLAQQPGLKERLLQWRNPYVSHVPSNIDSAAPRAKGAK